MGSDESRIEGHRIPAVQVESGGKYKNSRGMTVIKDGIKAEALMPSLITVIPRLFLYLPPLST